MNKIKIINLPEITAADNTTYIPVATGATNTTRKISAANLAGSNNVSYLPQEKSGMEMTQARANIGAAAKSYATIEDNLTIAYSSDPLDPNGDEVFKIENLDNPDGPDVTVDDWGYMYLRKGIYLAAGADIEGVTSDDFFNLKDITSPVQDQLDSKAPAESPTFTGTTNFEGDVQVSENVTVDGDVRAYKNIVDSWLQFGAGAKIKIQTGMNGGTPVYREFPATELSSSDLNGTQYVMVYGTGTPEENAAELQAAYNEAKTMPRYLGTLSSTTPIQMYKGQIYSIFTGSYLYEKVIEDKIFNPFNTTGNTVRVDESEAESIRTTVIVAPGEYNFGSSGFTLNTSRIDVKSLTGKKDVLVNTVNVQSDYCYVAGINCREGSFVVSDNLSNIVIENCEGRGVNSFCGEFQNGVTASGTFIDCIGGDYSFASYGVASGKFIRCIGGDYSFGTEGTLTGHFEDCKGKDYSFGENGLINSNATFIRCEGGIESFGSGGTISNSKFIDCEGNQGSFGYNGTIHNVAQFIRCSGGDYSFGSEGVASGKFIDCKGGIYSFGGTSQSIYSIKGDGEFIRCVGGDYSFGNCPFDDINSSAGAQKFIDCIGGNYSFGFDKDASGSYFRCIGGTNAFGAGDGSSIQGKFYYCVGGENTSMGGLRFSCVINDAPAT